VDVCQSTAKKDDDPAAAIKDFEAIVASESDSKSEWGWKSLKQLTKITFKRLHQYEKSLEYYKALLVYIKSSVTKNAAEKTISGILDYVSSEKDLDVALMEKWFDVTETALKESKNEVSVKDYVRGKEVLI
jgi:COP9 signalosome complex subunit 2